MLAAFTMGSALGGKLAAKYSIRRVVIIGGIIVSVGFFIASFITESFGWMLWLSYGLMGGAGMGFTYSTSIACAQKWFPHKKGLVSGIIVSSLGFGGVIFTPIVESLITTLGVEGVVGSGELSSIRVLSVVFLVVCTVCSLFMKNPPEGYMLDKVSAKGSSAKVVKDLSTSEMLRTPHFYMITATFLLSCMGGLMMIGFAKPIAEARDLAEAAVIGVFAATLSNSLGRLVWGAITDKLGSINTLIVLLTGSAILSLLVNSTTGYWLFVLIAFIGFFYGGIIGSFPALTASLFGAKHMAANYGIVLLGFGAGAILSSQIAGHFRNLASEDINLMYPAFIIGSCCSAVGACMMLFLKRSENGKPRRARRPRRVIPTSTSL
jgi:OFA family oxalate/formate antiporter-like MFS transporter